MSRKLTESQLIEHKNQAIKQLDNYISSLILNDNDQIRSKADKLSFWIKDYVRFLTMEANFSPTRRPKYKRGQIVKVHLGYKIGSEEGGLHYAIVLDNNNSVNSPTVTIIPLTSVKSSYITPKANEVYLGQEIYDALRAKITSATTDEDRRKKIENEILRMKQGSIALIGQITTVSKIRIYDPIHSKGVFSNIKISEKSLNLIDEAIVSLYTKCIK